MNYLSVNGWVCSKRLISMARGVLLPTFISPRFGFNIPKFPIINWFNTFSYSEK